MTDETMLDKITKLLAKAESTNHPAEAEALTAKAMELMTKWAIDDALLEAHRGKAHGPTDRIIEVQVPLRGVYHQAHQSLASGVARALGLKVIRTWQRESRDVKAQLVWVGFESDATKAQLLYTSLTAQCLTAQREFMKEWLERYPYHAGSASEKFKARRAFIFGFADRVVERLTELRKTAVTTSTDSSTALVLRDRSTLIDEFMAEKYGRLTKGRSASLSMGTGGYRGGRAAGDRAGLATSSVGAGVKGAIGR